MIKNLNALTTEERYSWGGKLSSALIFNSHATLAIDFRLQDSDDWFNLPAGASVEIEAEDTSLDNSKKIVSDAFQYRAPSGAGPVIQLIYAVR